MLTLARVLTDDLDEKITTHKTTSNAVETIPFAIDGASYEIDLGTANAGRLRSVFLPYIEHARRVNRNGHHPQPKQHRARPDNAAVREWAKSQGIQVRERGRIPAEIVDRHHAATQVPAETVPLKPSKRKGSS
jgi:hypothetical protein